MLAPVKVFRGVLVLGRIAAAHITADQTHTQVDPCVSHFHAFFAFPYIGLLKFNLIEMRALLRHGSSSNYPLAK
jgi:hypothetical protein